MRFPDPWTEPPAASDVVAAPHAVRFRPRLVELCGLRRYGRLYRSSGLKRAFTRPAPRQEENSRPGSTEKSAERSQFWKSITPFLARTSAKIGFDFAVRMNPIPGGRKGGGLIRVVRFSPQQAVPVPWYQTDHRAKALANQSWFKRTECDMSSNEFCKNSGRCHRMSHSPRGKFNKAALKHFFG